MMKQTSVIFKFLTLAMGLFLSSQAHSLIDIRLGYASLGGEPSNYNTFLKDSYGSGKVAPAPTGFQADVMFRPPGFSFGVGARYQALSATGKFDGDTFKEEQTNLGLLLSYRIWNTGFWLGPIASIGLADKSKLTIKEDGGGTTNLTPGSTSSYSIGVEGGVHLGIFMIGLELAYFNAKATKFRTGSGGFIESNDNNKRLNDIERSGLSTQLILGLGF